MKKLFTLLVLLVAIVTGAQADAEWNMANWSTDHTGLTYWASGSSANIPSTSTDKTVPAWADASTYATYCGTGGSSNFQLDSKTGTWKSSNPNRVFSFDVSANDEIKVYFCGGGSGNRSIYVSYNASTTNRDTNTAFGSATADGYTPTILAATATTAGTVYVWCDANVRFYAIKVKSGATEAFTVTFDAGTNGTCATSSLTETAPGAGVTLPEVTANEGYGFTGWYTDASDETTKVGDAGETYNPTEDITLQAGYSALAAPTIEIDNNTVSTYKGVAKTFTATATGVPDPTVKWYQSETAATTGGTEVGSGATYSPDVTTGGIFYYYAVASNSQGSSTSEVITLTVTDPDKHITGNEYFMSVDETPVPDEKIYCTDITMQFVNGKAGESFTAGVTDNMLNGVNANYVASIGGSSGNNGWKARFTPTADGVLKVGVIINKNKTFSITNVNSFSYVGKNGKMDNTVNPPVADPEDVSATVNSNSLTTPNTDEGKLYVEVTIDVESGKTYDFSVAGSKMGFYGFEFVPEGTTIPVTVKAAKYATFVPSQAVSFEGSGVKAFAAVYNEATGGATLNEVTAAPAGTPLVVNAEAGTYDLTVVATSETTAPAQNNLKISDGTVEGDMQTIYGLKNGAQGVGFYPVTQNATIAAGKVYLEIPAGEGAREFIGFGGEEVVTGIDAIENGTIANDAPAYNLAGQKVGKGYKGIVIINGKKVVK